MSTAATAGRRVVLADDEMMMRQMLKAILSEGKYEVVGEAINGAEVVSMCVRLQPDILCLDINMPKMDGIEALKALRKEMPDIHVLMISGNTSSDKVKEAISLGAKDFIVKPFNANQVLERLVKIFGTAPEELAKTEAEAKE